MAVVCFFGSFNFFGFAGVLAVVGSFTFLGFAGVLRIIVFSVRDTVMQLESSGRRKQSE